MQFAVSAAWWETPMNKLVSLGSQKLAERGCLLRKAREEGLAGRAVQVDMRGTTVSN